MYPLQQAGNKEFLNNTPGAKYSLLVQYYSVCRFRRQFWVPSDRYSHPQSARCRHHLCAIRRGQESSHSPSSAELRHNCLLQPVHPPTGACKDMDIQNKY